MDGGGESSVAAIRGLALATIRPRKRFRTGPLGGGRGATDDGDTAATERGLPRPPPAAKDIRESDRAGKDLTSMAEPRRAAARPSLRIEGGRFLIVEARFYDTISDDLRAGARRALAAAGASCEVVSVDGALEIPAGMAIALDAAEDGGRAYDGAVALGCVVRGETFHFEIVAGSRRAR